MKLPGPTGGCLFLAAHVYNLSHFSCDKTLPPKQLMGEMVYFGLQLQRYTVPHSRDMTADREGETVRCQEQEAGQSHCIFT